MSEQNDAIVRSPMGREIRRRAGTVRELALVKRAERAMWATGDYGAIARALIWEVGARVVERVGVRPGERVLDVACGTGNAAIRAARAGGDVVGLDLTPELLEEGRRIAAAAGVELEWVEGDAEALPFDDGGFDVVVSVFGCMFAPRHDVAARELARVLAPGGRIGLCSWTPQSSIAELMGTLFAYLPPAPEFTQPPPLWGSEEHVAGLFAGTGVRVRFEREHVAMRFPSVEHALRTFETKWGPFVQAREQLEPDRWSALRGELAAVLERRGSSREGRLVLGGEYLTTVGDSP
jgi:SAM-dependent methyltransferase